jgi:hypothetical protein
MANDNNTTGRDGDIVRKALAAAIVAYDLHPGPKKPLSDIADMKALLAAMTTARPYWTTLLLYEAELNLTQPNDGGAALRIKYDIELTKKGGPVGPPKR